MEADFWKNKWQKSEIGFHKPEVNEILKSYLGSLKLEVGQRIFIPLCGKTLDVIWLAEQGYKVCGIELVETAVEQLFAENKIKAEVESIAGLKRFSAKNIEIWCGDFFDLTAESLGPVDAVWDRASLVALPAKSRLSYAQHLMKLTNGAQQLLVTFDYDQTKLDGPPFAISKEELDHHYKNQYVLSSLESTPISGGLKGKCPALENVWLLEPLD